MIARRLQLQCLEHRYAPAGNVTAVVVDGDLFLTGDAADNGVYVYSSTSGNVRVSSGVGTTVNGQADAFLSLTGFTGDVHAHMLGGNDFVRVIGFHSNRFPGSIVTNLGSGNDLFSLSGPSGEAGQLGRVPVAGSVFVNGREGNDTFHLERAEVAGDVSFYGGEGNDEFEDSNTNRAWGTFITGQLTVDLSTGDDTIAVGELTVDRVRINDPIGITTGSDVSLRGLQVPTRMEMYLSIGDDTLNIHGADDGYSFDLTSIGELIVHTGNGDDNVTVHHAELGSLALYTGEGNEGGGFYGVTLTELEVARFLYVDLAGGFDNILLDDIAAEEIEVYGGSESDGIIAMNIAAADALFAVWDAADVIGLHESTYDRLSVNLGSGNDDLWVRDLSVSELATFDGKTGTNIYHDLGGNAFGQLIRVLV